MCACVHPKRSPVFQNPPAGLPLLELFSVPVPCSVFPNDPLPAQIPTKFAHSFQPKYVPLTPLPPHIRHLPCIPLPLHISCNPTTGNCFRPAPLLVPPLVNYVVPPSQMQPVSGDHRLQLTRLSNFPATRGRCRNSHARQPHCLAASRWPHMYLYSQPHPSTADHPGPSFQKIQLPAHPLKHNNLEAISSETEQQ